MTNKPRFLGLLTVLLTAAAVAVAKENAAVKGDERYKVTFRGGTYYFASEANRKLFKTAPTKYTPQYGGYCAVAVSIGQLEDADPLMFTIHNNKLLVQRNGKAHQMFLSNLDM